MIKITSRDYWFKIVEFLQQTWALIEVNGDSTATVLFVNDTSGVFDRMVFTSTNEAQRGLRRNGFNPLSEDKEAQKFIAAPEPPFKEATHPNGLIYSSGRFWKS